MRALLMTEPSTSSAGTSVTGRAEPEPGPREVSVQVAYAGINFIDVMARRGDPGYASAWPYVPGLEIAGTVLRVGSGVVGLHAGQRVAAITAGGGLAEIAVAQAELVVALPDAVPFPVAASAPLMLSTALLLLTDVARLQPGESVLMHSAGGGVGTAVAQLVPLLGGGLRIGTVGASSKIAKARYVGWDVAISREDDVASAVFAAAERGVDVVLDPSGTTLLELDLAVAAPGARIALFGNAGGGVPGPLPPPSASPRPCRGCSTGWPAMRFGSPLPKWVRSRRFRACTTDSRPARAPASTSLGSPLDARSLVSPDPAEDVPVLGELPDSPPRSANYGSGSTPPGVNRET